jgi:alkylation response protein AidB-like acyl-CoA dehydrogenase
MAQVLSGVTPVSALTVDCAAVDFDLSTDQQALRDAAVTLLDRMAGHDALRARVGAGSVVGTLPGAGEAGQAGGTAAAVDAPTGYDTAAWAAMAEQGWLALEIPEDEGGLGMGLVEIAVLCEEIGRRLAAVPFLSSVVALGALNEPAVRSLGWTKEWRDALSQGEAVACVARAGGADIVAEPATADATATTDAPDAVLLSGATPPTTFAPSADLVVVVTDENVFAVDQRDAPRPAPLSAMDRTRELGTLRFDRTPARHLGGADAVAAVLDRAATLVSAEMLGAADRVLAMTVEYAKDRVQFGKPIGSFQAVKHMLADCLVDVEGMRSTVYYAAWCGAAGDRERSLAASMAKAWCSDASRRVMASGLQVHGGIGFTWEHDMHLFLKRSQLDQLSYGDAAFHRDRIAGILRARLEAGESLS